ncbi:hypothetical protein M426DRAFT_23998 [Hypoxylon sp. CI-4A]|nr:hypothetical protein M426DRAFT_23998 [Hypoxylon sp. CI-4A]
MTLRSNTKRRNRLFVGSSHIVRHQNGAFPRLRVPHHDSEERFRVPPSHQAEAEFLATLVGVTANSPTFSRVWDPRQFVWGPCSNAREGHIFGGEATNREIGGGCYYNMVSLCSVVETEVFVLREREREEPESKLAGSNKNIGHTMAFSLTSKQVELRGCWLVALVQKGDGSWNTSRLNLNDFIGNNDGKFDVTMNKWYNSAQDWSCYIRGPFLCAQLRTVAGLYSPEVSINLDLFIRNRDGTLEFQTLGDSIFLYTACLSLLENATLRGLVVGRDGKFHISELDLDQYYGNINGKFEADERHYSRSGRNFALDRDLKLTAELMDHAGEHHQSEIDLSDHIINKRGKLAFVKRDEPLEKEHWTTSVTEQIPVLGSAVAGLHQLGELGGEDRLYRKIASSTNSAKITVGTAIGSFIGRAIRSPIVGSIIGAGLSTLPGIFVEGDVANAIDDSPFRSQVQEALLGRYVFETLRDIIAADETATAGEWLSAALDPSIDGWTKGLLDWLERQEITLLPEFSLYTMMQRVFTRLQGTNVEEWDKALELLADIKRRKETLKLEPEEEPQIIIEVPTPDEQQQPLVAEEPQAAEEVPPTITTEEPPKADSEQPQANGETTNNNNQQQAAAEQQAPPQTISSSSTRASSLKPDPNDESSRKSTSNNNNNNNGDKDKDKTSSVRGNGTSSSRKGWQNVLGISMLRSWSKHRQPKAVAV